MAKVLVAFSCAAGVLAATAATPGHAMTPAHGAPPAHTAAPWHKPAPVVAVRKPPALVRDGEA